MLLLIAIWNRLRGLRARPKSFLHFAFCIYHFAFCILRIPIPESAK